jgi:hypothetical protein
MQRACAILSSVACTAVQNFSTLSHRHHKFREMLLNTKYVFRLSLQIYPKHFSFYVEMSEIRSQMYIRLQVQNPLFLSELNET